MLNTKKTPRTRNYDSANHLIYVHIGKCGGASLWDAIKRSERLATSFDKVSRIHIKRPPIHQCSQYLIVARNPIRRALSAFNWRYRLVVVEKSQENRFPGEYDILKSYRTLDRLASRLYQDDVLDPEAAADFHRIHHLKEDISFYLTDLLAKISPAQIHGVLFTETLDQDVHRILGSDRLKKVHENRSATPPEQHQLTLQARENLARFLAADYEALTKLVQHYPVSDEQRKTVLAL